MSIAAASPGPDHGIAGPAGRPRQRTAVAMVAVTALAGLIAAAPFGPTAAVRAETCLEGTESRLVVELLFGRNIGKRLGVSEEQFQRFVDQEVTPRFPDGFTLVDTIGQWRPSSSREIVREPGKQLVIALADEAKDLPRVREIVAAYKRQFSQQSVIVLTRRACVAF